MYQLYNSYYINVSSIHDNHEIRKYYQKLMLKIASYNN